MKEKVLILQLHMMIYDLKGKLLIGDLILWQQIKSKIALFLKEK